MRIIGMPARLLPQAGHPLELVWSWQPLKPLMTLGLVHAGRLTVTRGMQGLLSAPCQTISATTGKIPARCEKSTKTAERHTHLCADRCTSAQPKLTARTYLVICASSAKLKWRAARTTGDHPREPSTSK